jgi:hypothetical protein
LRPGRGNRRSLHCAAVEMTELSLENQLQYRNNPIAASKVRHPSPLVIPTGAKRSGGICSSPGKLRIQPSNSRWPSIFEVCSLGPERTRISHFAMLARTTCAALRKVDHRPSPTRGRMKRSSGHPLFPQTNSVWVPHVRTSVRGLTKTGRSPIKALTTLPQSRTLGPISRSFLARCGIPPRYPRRSSPPSVLIPLRIKAEDGPPDH